MYLVHHGILGQKWGIRRYQNYDGTLTSLGRKRYYRDSDGVIKKNTKLYRQVFENPEDPTFDNKKYVSYLKEDNKIWRDYMGQQYGQNGDKVYEVMLKPIKDLKVASNETQRKVFEDEFFKPSEGDSSKSLIFDKPNKQNNITMDEAMRDTIEAYKFLDMKVPDKRPSAGEMGSINIAAQTRTGKAFRAALQARGYDAVSDIHGQNIDAKDPLIIFNPEENLKRIKSPKLSNKKYLKVYKKTQERKKTLEQLQFLNEQMNRQIEENTRRSQQQIQNQQVQQQVQNQIEQDQQIQQQIQQQMGELNAQIQTMQLMNAINYGFY